MVTDKKAPYGDITISKEAINAVAGDAAAECYGVVGLAPRSFLSENIGKLLKKEDYGEGVYIHRKKDDYEVDLYIAVAYGVKVTEVLSEVQKKVAYVLQKTFGFPFRTVNVYVQDIREIN